MATNSSKPDGFKATAATLEKYGPDMSPYFSQGELAYMLSLETKTIRKWVRKCEFRVNPKYNMRVGKNGRFQKMKYHTPDVFKFAVHAAVNFVRRGKQAMIGTGGTSDFREAKLQWEKVKADLSEVSANVRSVSFISRSEVSGAIHTAMVIFRKALLSWPRIIPSMLYGHSVEEIKAALENQFEKDLENGLEKALDFELFIGEQREMNLPTKYKA